ncbi:hypothetical protein B0H13DRAFT_2348477 [Mycena leptocephala]|nr:hypothetical protein B0H13DRAFT_2348477 [Mycena leptocephala]
MASEASGLGQCPWKAYSQQVLYRLSVFGQWCGQSSGGLEDSAPYKRPIRGKLLPAEKLDAGWARHVKSADERNLLAWNIMALGGRNRRVEKQWCDGGRRGGRREASFAWALNDVFGHVFCVIGDTGQLMGPVLVKAIIYFAKARAAAQETGGDLPSTGRRVAMAFGLIGIVLLASVSQHQFLHRSTATGVAVRAALTTCIYKRGVRLTGKDRVTLTNSKILNFISTDVSRIDACSQWFHAGKKSFIRV